MSLRILLVLAALSAGFVSIYKLEQNALAFQASLPPSVTIYGTRVDGTGHEQLVTSR
jgi:hypothetical protein